MQSSRLVSPRDSFLLQLGPADDLFPGVVGVEQDHEHDDAPAVAEHGAWL